MAAEAFALWITGLPASGKSTVTSRLKSMLADRGIDAMVLESDELRRTLTPGPNYDDAERERFYRRMISMGENLVSKGIPVIFDATANRSAWRQAARCAIPRFLEVFVDTPLKVCVARDPKGIYRRAREGTAQFVPGVQSAFEPPERPDVVIDGQADAAESAAKILGRLHVLGWVQGDARAA